MPSSVYWGLFTRGQSGQLLMLRTDITSMSSPILMTCSLLSYTYKSPSGPLRDSNLRNLLLHLTAWCIHIENGTVEVIKAVIIVIKSRRMRWAGHVARMGEERGVYRVLVGKPEGKRPLGWPRRRWVDNIRMYLQEVGCAYMDWIGVAQDRDRWRTLVSAVMNLRVPWNAGNFLTSCEPVSCSRRTLHCGVS